MINRRAYRIASVGYLLDSGYLWLARDLNGSIAAYSHKPFKLDDEVWYNEIGESKEMWMWVDDGDLYNFVKWEDDKPVNIREWLEKEEKEMKMYSVKDGELECREVDADFFEKNTTLGGLLTPKEVELDMDNRKVADGATIEVNTRNSVKSAILEKVKEIREALEMETNGSYGWELGMKRLGEAIAGPSYEPPVSIIADKFGYSHEPLDVASMYPGDAISDNATTLGGLLTPRELDRDNKIVTDSATIEVNTENSGYSAFYEMAEKFREGLKAGIDYEPSVSIVADQDDCGESIKVNDENSGNSAFYEMAEKFREALDVATEYGYKLSVSIVADNYTWGYNLPILDFKSMGPEQLTLDEPIPNHGKICKELTETYEKKNADYGNSFGNSLDKHGLIAGIVRMDDKMSRLISLNSKNEQQVMDESMRDTLMDLANYAIMSVMWLDEQ